MALAGVSGMLDGMLGMGGRGMNVVGYFFVITGPMVLGSLRIVSGSMLMAFSCFPRHDAGV